MCVDDRLSQCRVNAKLARERKKQYAASGLQV